MGIAVGCRVVVVMRGMGGLRVAPVIGQDFIDRIAYADGECGVGVSVVQQLGQRLCQRATATPCPGRVIDP